MCCKIVFFLFTTGALVSCSTYSRTAGARHSPEERGKVALQSWEKDIEWPLSQISQSIAMLVKENTVPSFERIETKLNENFKKNEKYDFGSWVTYEAYNCESNVDDIPGDKLKRICPNDGLIESYLFRIYKKKYWEIDGFRIDGSEQERISNRISIIRSSVTARDFDRILMTAVAPEKFQITKKYFSHLASDHVSTGYAHPDGHWIIAGSEHEYALKPRPNGVMTEHFLATIKVYIGGKNAEQH